MATVVVNHIGIRGDKGLNAKNGAGSSDVRGSLIESPAVKLFRPNKLSSLVSWTRDDEAAIADRYGNQTFVAGDEIRHRLAYSNDFEEGLKWGDSNGYWTRDSTNETDPFGGSTASQITLSDTTAGGSVMLADCDAFGGNVYRISCYVKVISGTITSVNASIGGLAANVFTFSQTLNGNWQRIDVLAIPSQITSSFNLNFVTTGAVIHLYQVNMTEGHKLHAPYTTGASPSEDVPNPDPVYRENQLGYCIEGQKTNLCPFSQDLNNWQTSGNPTIEENTIADAYGDINTPTRVAFTASQSVSLSQTVTLTEGASYSVSFYAVINSGLVESLNIQLGGGVVETAQITSGYTRQSVQLIAGSGATVQFNATSGVSGSSFVLTGVQVELGELSSYIPTGTASQTREADLVSLDGGAFPALNSPFTCRLSWSELSDIGNNKTLLSAGLVIEFDETDLKFDGVTVSDVINNQELIAVYDGSLLTIYIDAVEVYSGAYSPQTSAATTVYVGSTDALGSDALNGYIKAVDWWGFAMTQNEIEFISEVDHGNRNS